ncbi:sugar transferase, partial [uncultured Fibrobacter sp.]|uniref:sugar transferase n=1 Tax=uncultured Fibrobacter sp. TaxID=261512 RepID=UPI002605EC88
VLMIIGAIAMKGNPFFTQPRPGKDERIFKLIKFRSMTNERDASGKLLPDDVRLNSYGKFLRSTSLDELPELFNILKGDMSVIGPRPQLVRDMVFMTPEQRKRHTVRQGLSGLAQVNGRNAVTWETKIDFDLKYIEHITFWGDIKIIFVTLYKAFFKRSDITEENCDTATDLGDYLLAQGRITQEEYDRGQKEAKRLIEEAM